MAVPDFGIQLLLLPSLFTNLLGLSTRLFITTKLSKISKLLRDALASFAADDMSLKYPCTTSVATVLH